MVVVDVVLVAVCGGTRWVGDGCADLPWMVWSRGDTERYSTHAWLARVTYHHSAVYFLRPATEQAQVVEKRSGRKSKDTTNHIWIDRRVVVGFTRTIQKHSVSVNTSSYNTSPSSLLYRFYLFFLLPFSKRDKLTATKGSWLAGTCQHCRPQRLPQQALRDTKKASSFNSPLR